jgi:hypothetical protein
LTHVSIILSRQGVFTSRQKLSNLSGEPARAHQSIDRLGLDSETRDSIANATNPPKDRDKKVNRFLQKQGKSIVSTSTIQRALKDIRARG